MRRLEEMELKQLKEKLNGLSTAHESPAVYVEKTENGELVPVQSTRHKAIVNDKTGELENFVSKDYVVIQHRDAFSAIVDAMIALKGEDQPVRASVCEEKGRTYLAATFPEIKVDDGEQGIELGFKAVNSYNKTTALRYGSKQVATSNNDHFEFFGYRLACLNGMTVRASLSFAAGEPRIIDRFNARVGDLVEVRLEEVNAGEKVVSEPVRAYIRHYGKGAKLNLVRLERAILGLKHIVPEIERNITAARLREFESRKVAEELLEKLGFGDRQRETIMGAYSLEAQTEWGLYNAITGVATHEKGKSLQTMERMLKMAQPILVRA